MRRFSVGEITGVNSGGTILFGEQERRKKQDSTQVVGTQAERVEPGKISVGTQAEQR